MGLAELFIRPASPAAERSERAISEFAIVNGDPVFGSAYGSGAYGGAMSIPGAWRCALLLSDLLGGVPWHGYRERAGHPAERLAPTPSLLEQPAPPDTRVTTISSLALDAIWHGNAIGVWAARNRDGWPTAMVPVPADWVGVRRAREGEPWEPGEVLYDIGGRTFTAPEVFHLKGPCPPGALRGLGVLECHLGGALKLAADQLTQAQTIGRHGVPTGLIQIEDTAEDPLTSEEADEVRANWLRRQRERSIAVVNARTKFTPLAWNPTDLQLVDARKLSLHELALIFGLDPSWLGVSGDSMTYANIEGRAADLLKFNAPAGLIARFEASLTAAMPRGTWAAANLDALLRSDTLTRYQAHSLAYGKWLTDDEIREIERLPPLTAEQRAQLAPAPAPPADDQTPDDAEEAS